MSDKNNKDMISQAIYLIGNWKLWEHVDIPQICEQVVEIHIDHVISLLGKKSELDQALKTKYGVTLIENLLKKNQSKYLKTCDNLCQKIGVSLDEFPILVESKKKNAVNYFLGNYLKNKPEDPGYWGLDQVEDLLTDLPEYLAVLIDLLYQKSRLHEAKGVFMRHNLKATDFPQNL
jgi:hypothetical protein